MKPMRTRVWVAAAASALLLGGCGDRRSTEQIVLEARAKTEKQDFQTAVIELKSVLQKEPGNGPARFELGRTLLKAGDPVTAAIELRKSLELGVPPVQAQPLLAAAMLAQGQFREVVREFGNAALPDARAQAELLAVVATAHAALGELPKASEVVTAGLAGLPDHGPLLVIKSQLEAAGGQLDAALATADALLAREPAFVSGLLLRADLLHRGRRDLAAARAGYEKAAEVDPRSVGALTGLIGVLIEGQDVEAARTQQAKLRQLAPGGFLTRLYEGQLAYASGDFAKARELVDPLLRDFPDEVRVMQLSAVTEMRLNSLVKAESLLARITRTNGSLPMPRYLLARVYNITGQPRKALEILQPLIGSDSRDATALALAGEASILAGEIPRAEDFYAQVLKLEPRAASANTVLGLSELARGNATAGFAQLEEAARLDPSAAADMVLVTERMRRQDMAGAGRAIDALQQKLPKSPLPHLLRAQIRLQGRDVEGAGASFAEALKADPGYFPALSGLAQIDLQRGQPAAARKRFDDAVAVQPRNVQALMALAELDVRERAPRETVLGRLNAAIAADAADPAPRVALVNYLQSLRDGKASLTAAQEASAALPDHPQVMVALGRAQLQNGEAQQAVATFSRLSSTYPGSPIGHLQMAEVQLALADRDGARASLRKALDVAPAELQAQSMLIGLDVEQKRFDAALATARAVQRQRPAEPSGHALEGDVHAARKTWDAAAESYRKALQLAVADAGLAYKHFNALRSAGRARDATAFAAGWQTEGPGREGLLLLLGDDAILAKDWPRAEDHYRQLLARVKDHSRAMNNLAMAVLEQGRGAEALPLAERALALEPENPAYMDTLSRVLAARDELPRALELQRKALTLSPDDPFMRLHLARVLIKAGQKDAARAELEKLARLGGRFEAQGEVTRLMASL